MPTAISQIVKITTETGEAFAGGTNGEFGGSFLDLGDLAGDGTRAVLIGEPGENRLQLVYLDIYGDITDAIEITISDPLREGRLGQSLADLGDLKGDGTRCVAAGAQGDAAYFSGKGLVHLFFLTTAGVVDDRIVIEDGVTNGPTLNANDNFGISLAALGDIKGDGTECLAIGIDQDDNGGSDQGAVFLAFIDSTGAIDFSQEINSGTSGLPSFGAAPSRFGRSLAALGDIKDDGTHCLAVGAPQSSLGTTTAGCVWLIFLTDGVTTTIDDWERIDGDETDSLFGQSLTSLGDLLNNGTHCLAIGEPDATIFGDPGEFGQVSLVYLDDTASVTETQVLQDGTATVSLTDGDAFGTALGKLTNYPTTNATSLFIGAIGDDTEGSGYGAAYLVNFSNIPTALSKHHFLEFSNWSTDVDGNGQVVLNADGSVNFSVASSGWAFLSLTGIKVTAGGSYDVIIIRDEASGVTNYKSAKITGDPVVTESDTLAGFHRIAVETTGSTMDIQFGIGVESVHAAGSAAKVSAVYIVARGENPTVERSSRQFISPYSGIIG